MTLNYKPINVNISNTFCAVCAIKVNRQGSYAAA